MPAVEAAAFEVLTDAVDEALGLIDSEPRFFVVEAEELRYPILAEIVMERRGGSGDLMRTRRAPLG